MYLHFKAMVDPRVSVNEYAIDKSSLTRSSQLNWGNTLGLNQSYYSGRRLYQYNKEVFFKKSSSLYYHCILYHTIVINIVINKWLSNRPCSARHYFGNKKHKTPRTLLVSGFLKCRLITLKIQKSHILGSLLEV